LPQAGASVLVVSDHVAVRDRFRTGLADAGFALSTAPSVDAAVRTVGRGRADICLLDLAAPPGGAAAVTRILDAAPATLVVALAFSDGDDDVLDALEAGAAGCLLKDVDAALLAGILPRAFDGEALVSRRLTARVLEELREHGHRRRVLAERAFGAELTPREWEVLDLLCRNLTTSEIAGRLFIAPVTVRSHIASVLRKLRAPDRRAALRLLARDGLWPGRRGHV